MAPVGARSGFTHNQLSYRYYDYFDGIGLSVRGWPKKSCLIYVPSLCPHPYPSPRGRGEQFAKLQTLFKVNLDMPPAD
jgi:hypothetical protein